MKTNKSVKDFNWLDPPASPASTYGGQDTKKSLIEPRAELRPELRKGSTSHLLKFFFFKIPDLVHRAAPDLLKVNSFGQANFVTGNFAQRNWPNMP